MIFSFVLGSMAWDWGDGCAELGDLTPCPEGSRCGRVSYRGGRVPET
jgi:hypothetical protein